MEECPLFNAGVGSVFTYDGTHGEACRGISSPPLRSRFLCLCSELDASIMDGKTRKAGAKSGCLVLSPCLWFLFCRRRLWCSDCPQSRLSRTVCAACLESQLLLSFSPLRFALRRVMERSVHVMLAGAGAEGFAKVPSIMLALSHLTVLGCWIHVFPWRSRG